MRIALVAETYPPDINGVALAVQALAQALAASGHSVEFVRPLELIRKYFSHGVSG